MFEESIIFDPEVQKHLEDLRAAYRCRMFNRAQKTLPSLHCKGKTTLPPATNTWGNTITIPLTSELIDYLRRAG